MEFVLFLALEFGYPNMNLKQIPIFCLYLFIFLNSVQARSQSTEDNQNDITDKTVPIDEDCSEDEEDDINDHHGASKWLEGMGLNKKDFPSLEPLKVKLYPFFCLIFGLHFFL